MAKTDLCVVLFLTTFSKASILGMTLAFSMAASTQPGLYPLARSKDFNSLNLVSLASGCEHILTILRAREKGIFSVTWAG